MSNGFVIDGIVIKITIQDELKKFLTNDLISRKEVRKKRITKSWDK